MAGGNPSNIPDELGGLQNVVQIACTGAISRTVTVLTHETDGFWTGTWPLITLDIADYRVDRLFGGITGTKGQTPKQPSVYSITIEDKLDPRVAGTDRTAASQADCRALITAIVAAFDHVRYRILPDANGVPCADVAGEHIRFRRVPTFKDAAGGDVRVQFVGAISVVGLVHRGTDP